MSSVRAALAVAILAFSLYVVPTYLYPYHAMTSTTSSVPRGPVTFVLDFDNTITETATIPYIIRAAAHYNNKLEFIPPWMEAVMMYADHAYRLNDTVGLPPIETTKQAIDFWRSTRHAEETSFTRLSRSGILGGISEPQWEKFGRESVQRGKTVVRDGFAKFLDIIEKSKEPWAIISVSTSTAFIRGVLSAAVGERNVSIVGNQIDKGGVIKGPLKSDGKPGKLLTASDSKLAALRGLMRGKEQRQVVYIGDSGADIECLVMDGAIGIIMINGEYPTSLPDMMRQVGWKLVPIGKYNGTLNNTLYLATDFVEIVKSPLMKMVQSPMVQ
jgi:2-hydroxy-3-keto-5-methylthiopentenyl-1-phosphate phosphatase